MKRLLSFLLAICLIFGQVPATAFAVEPGTAPEATASPVEEKAPVLGATSGICGENLTWTLSDDGVLTISGEGPMANYDVLEGPWVYSRSLITAVSIENGVTTIGDHAFWGCDSLTSVEIPDSVTSIGSYAFEYCDSLTSVEIPGSVTTIGNYAFYDCYRLTSVEIPDSVTTIGDEAFCGCSSLTSVEIPDSATTIGREVFLFCNSLTGIYVDENNPAYSSDEYGVLYNKQKTLLIQAPGAISGSYVIPDSVTAMLYRAFTSCDSLTSFYVDENNPVYSSDSRGVLYNKKKTTLIQAPGAISGSYVIPDSVTLISESAFYNCDSLTSVEIGDSVTYIDNDAFSFCDSLTSVEIGDSVTTIRDDVFFLCDRLTEIIFRGNAPSIDDDAFRGANTTAYYPANNSTWTYNKLKNYGGNITWVPYLPAISGSSAIYGRPETDQLLLCPYELDSFWSNFSTLSNVTISYSGGEYIFNAAGTIIPLQEAMEQDIILSKDGYQDYILPKAVTETLINEDLEFYSLSSYMQKDQKDGKPYISTVFGRESGSGDPYVDLRVSKLTAAKDKKQDIIVTAVGFGNKDATYYIGQDGSRRVESKTGVFSAKDLFSVFQDEVSVYAYAKASDGTTTEPQEIKIVREELDGAVENFFTQSEFSLFGQDFLKFKVSDSIPVLRNAEFSLEAFSIPLGFEIEGNEIKISLGLDVFERKSGEDGVETKDIFHNFKELVFSTTSKISSGKEKIDDYKRTLQAVNAFCEKEKIKRIGWIAEGDKSNSFNVNVLGYLEGTIVNGDIVVKEGALSIGGKFVFQYTAQGAVWVIPVYGGFEAGGSVTASGKVARVLPDKDVPLEFGIILEITPEITGRAGVGVKGAISAGLYATGKMPIKTEFMEQHFTLGLSGEIGVEGELFILKGKKALLDGETTLIDHYWGNKSTSVNAVTILDDGCPDNSSTVTTVVSRDYAENTSDWLGDWYFAPTVDGDGSAVAAKGVSFRDLQTSIFSNSQPQLVTVGDQMLLVWVEDDLNRDTYNRMRLVYSVYDPMMETWSEPAPVWDDGHNDGYPVLASDGENAYVLWQKVNTTLTEENTTDIDTALENSELCLAKFEDGAFVDAQMLTSDSLYEYAHTVSIINGEPVVFWASSTENAMNVSGNNVLYRWENDTTEELARNLNYVLSIDAIDSEVTYVMDADGELDTTADVTAFTISDVDTTSFDNSELGAAITWAGYAPLDGEEVLFLSDMGNVYYEQDGELKSVLSGARTMGGNLNIVETDLGTAILWTEQVDGWNELFAATYEDGIWSEAVQISENEELLTKVTAVCYDGKLTGICNTNSVTYDGSTETYIKGETDLALFTVNDFSDIELGSYLTINEEELEIGEETELYVTVYNNGTLPVDEVTFTITDTLGTESEQTVYIDIPSGGSEIVTLTYPVPEGYTSTTLTVTAAIDDTDANEEDNSVSLEIGNHDLSVTETAVEMLEGGYLLKAVIENGSLVDAEKVTLSVSVDDEESAPLETVTVGTIMRENYALAEILLAEEALTFDENGAAKVYLKLNADGTESADVDNSICIIVTEAAETVCMHPVTETVEKLDATCIEPGHEAYEICAACGEAMSEIVEIPAGHHYENGICTDCGEADPDYVPDEITGTCGDHLTWVFTKDGVLTVSGEGDMWDFDSDHPCPWAAYTEQITSVVIEEGVTSIGDTAFLFSTIESVSIPNSVTRIGVAAFRYNLNLTDVDLPDNLLSIGEEAFALSGLTEVTIPAQVNEIGPRAFLCQNMTEIYVDEANANYYSWNGLLYHVGHLVQVPCAMEGELVLPELTMSIYPYALCGSLVTGVDIPAYCTEIGELAFQSCSALTTICFRGNAPTIAENAFSGQNIVITYPDANTTWTEEARQNYGGTIEWQPMGEDLVAYGYCGENNTQKENSHLYRDSIAGTNATWTLTSDGTMTISGEGRMMDCGFQGNHPWISNAESITKVVIEEGISYMGFAPFMDVIGCGNIRELVLPSTLEAFSDQACYLMSGLEKVNIPAAVTSIGMDAFGNCTSLTEIRFSGDAPSIDSSAFTGVTATACYPANNPTWTDDVMQDYGGAITWEPYFVSNLTVLTVGDVNALEQNNGDGWNFEPETDTLYLWGGGYDGDAEAAIYAEGDLTICLVPETGSGFHGVNNGVLVIGDLTITGPGHLLATASAEYNQGGAYGPCGIYATGNLTIVDTNVTAETDLVGIGCNGSLEIIGSSVNAFGARNGIFTHGDIRISASTVESHATSVQSDNKWDFRGYFLMGIFAGEGNLTIENQSNVYVSADQFGIYAQEMSIDSSSLNTSATLAGIIAEKLVSVTGESNVFAIATLEEEQKDEYGEDACAILSNGQIFIGKELRLEFGRIGTVDSDSEQQTIVFEDGTVSQIASIVPVTEIAAGWSGATTWKLYDDGTLRVFGNGNMKNYDYGGGQPWLNKGVDIISVVIEEGVTGIGSGAFKDLTSLKTVTLPETLTRMGEAAFYGSGLESVEIPASLWTIQPYTFKNCVNLTSVTFHEGNLEKISDGAFYGTGLTEVVLPDCLDILDIFVFKGCENLTSITIGSGLTELREAVFYGTAIPTITIPEGITKIGPYAFKNCVKLETIELPESLISVGEASFYADTALKIVELPDAVTEIGNYAFRKCESIETLKLSEELVTVGECAFYGCTGLKELVIPDKVTTIKPYAFKTCTGLTSVTLGNSVESIGEGAFNTCTGIKTIVFPASLKAIGDYAFSNSENLWKLTFQGDAPAIGTGAFKGLDAYGYYPGDNATWTSAKMQNYGGNITWKAN